MCSICACAKLSAGEKFKTDAMQSLAAAAAATTRQLAIAFLFEVLDIPYFYQFSMTPIAVACRQ